VLTIDERVSLLHQCMNHFADALAWPHVGEDPRRRRGILAAIQWSADEIGRIATAESRLNAWVHPDILQAESALALQRVEIDRRVAASRAAKSRANTQEGT
jgi:hypothetical protein